MGNAAFLYVQRNRCFLSWDIPQLHQVCKDNWQKGVESHKKVT